jgi:multidrug efflux pump subunit AcrA (membrane-fusion protein)
MVPAPSNSASVAELIALFAGPLSSVRFPDVDHATLVELAALVDRAQADVDEARARLSAAESALEARRSDLVARAHRAKAYARVYAEGDVELQATLDRLTLPKVGAPLLAREGHAAQPRPADTEPKRRGRPRKVRDESTLFEVGASVDVSAAE